MPSQSWNSYLNYLVVQLFVHDDLMLVEKHSLSHLVDNLCVALEVKLGIASEILQPGHSLHSLGKVCCCLLMALALTVAFMGRLGRQALAALLQGTNPLLQGPNLVLSGHLLTH